MYFDAYTLSAKGSFKSTKIERNMIKRTDDEPHYSELKSSLDQARFVMEHIGWDPAFADELFDLWQNKKLVDANHIAILKRELSAKLAEDRDDEAQAMAEICGETPIAETAVHKRRGRKPKEA